MGLKGVPGNINELARVSGCKNLEIPTGSPTNEKKKKKKEWETIPMFTKISKTFRKDQENKYPTCKSSSVIEKVPRQTRKSTYATHSTSKKVTVGNIPEGHKYCSRFAFCGEGEGAQIIGSECITVQYQRMMSSYNGKTS